MTLIIIAILAALFSSGCVSSRAVRSMIDEQIAANNQTYLDPALAQQTQQISAVKAEAVRNREAISKSSAQVAVHQTVLVDQYKNQQQQASNALLALEVNSAPAAPLDSTPDLERPTP